MNYTKKQRADIARALKAAKPLLWDGSGGFCPFVENQYICDAINSANRREISDMARDLVAARIDNHFSLRGWLVANGVNECEMDNSRLQAHRHAWLDQLIEEFSK